ncbi:nucleotidyltransferase [Streptomyces sp. NPDC048357]|uniref:nucleotidyltransferase domain-containing protein n=1 Tax=Streptomyces sp. NPDC048357 TaxID=3154719 RepID=UPI00342D9A80
MNRTLERHFEIFFQRISLSGNQRKAALNRAEEICAFLRAESNVSECFVSGSISRSTAVRNFSDIDIIAAMNEETPPETRPDSVVSDLLSTLQIRYPQARISENTVRISFPSGPDVDVLPALEVSSPGVGTFSIPTFNRDAWERFIPSEQTRLVRDIDARLGGELTQLIKLVKWWSHLHEQIIPSFRIEQIACAVFEHEMPPMNRAVVDFFDVANQQLGNSSRIQSEKTREAHALAAKAVELEDRGDIQESIDHWGCLLGDQFPTVIV